MDRHPVIGAIVQRLGRVTAADVEILARLPRVPGAREAADDAARALGQATFFPTAGLRLADRGGGVVIDDCMQWARWAWHFTEPGWDAAELVLDDALAVLRMAHRLPPDLVEAVVKPVTDMLGIPTALRAGRASRTN